MKKENSIFGFITLILLIFILGLILFSILSLKKQAGFTELYFVGNISKEAHSGYEYPFSFAIHNLENSDMGYDYSVYVNSSIINNSSIIDTGYSIVEQGEIDIINEIFLAEDKYANSSVVVSVKLLSKNQEIHFWVDVK